MRALALLMFAMGLAAAMPAAEAKSPAAAPGKSEVVGTLVKNEDAGYPFARLIVKATGATTTQEFLINQEDAFVEGQQNGKNEPMVGKKVRLVLETKTVARASQIVRNGMNLDSEKKPVRAKKPRKGELTITGILSGADETQGDVAPVLSVTAKNGRKVDFDLFAPPAVVKANGKQVTLIYTMESETRVKELRYAK